MIPRVKQPNRFPRPAGVAMGMDIPSDGRFYLTSFGGGSDTQNVACHGAHIADGTWYYAADSQRWPCGTKLRVTNPANGRTVIVQVADAGPALWVEQAAGGMPILDASPLVSQALFGSASSGYEDHRVVVVEVADPSTPLGSSDTQAVSSSGSAKVVLAIGVLAAIGLWLVREPKAKPLMRARREPRRNPAIESGTVFEHVQQTVAAFLHRYHAIVPSTRFSRRGNDLIVQNVDLQALEKGNGALQFWRAVQNAGMRLEVHSRDFGLGTIVLRGVG